MHATVLRNVRNALHLLLARFTKLKWQLDKAVATHWIT